MSSTENSFLLKSSVEDTSSFDNLILYMPLKNIPKNVHDMKIFKKSNVVIFYITFTFIFYHALSSSKAELYVVNEPSISQVT